MVQFNSVLFGVLTVTGGNMGLKFVGWNGFNKLVGGSNPSKSMSCSHSTIDRST